jgi:hypothetical protein
MIIVLQVLLVKHWEIGLSQFRRRPCVFISSQQIPHRIRRLFIILLNVPVNASSALMINLKSLCGLCHCVEFRKSVTDYFNTQ